MIVTERFFLNPLTKRALRQRKEKFGYGLLGLATYYRTYSRIKADGSQERWADTVIRCVEGALSIRKNHYLMNGLRWDDEHWQTVAIRMANAIFDIRMLPPGRGLWIQGTDTVYERGSMALNNCFAGHERIYTQEHGLVPLRDLVDETVHVLTRDGWKQATGHHYGRQMLQRVTFAPIIMEDRGPRLLRSSIRHTKDVTANHRWHIWGGWTTTELKVGDVVMPNVANVDTNDPDYLYGFRHGFVFGDGTKQSGRTYRIRLCGEKDAIYKDRFEKVNTPDYLKGDSLAFVYSDDDLKAFPNESYSQPYMAGFIEGWMAADANQGRLSSQNPNAVEWLKGHAPLAGYVVTGANADITMTTNYGPRKNPLFRITLSKQKIAWKVVNIDELDEDHVYCVENRENGFFTLEGGLHTGNCAFTSVTKLSRDAAWVMDALMLGVGVGFDTHRAVIDLQRPRDEKIVYTIPDTREGWVEATRLLIASYEEGTQTVEFDYSLVRPAGQPIRGFGGVASGPEPLRKLHERLRILLTDRANGTISSVRCITDTINLVAKCVVAGNVRRSALIALGRPDDTEFLDIKDWRKPENAERMHWETGWGYTSNNSVVLESADDFDYLPDVASRVGLAGEPGILNLMNVQKYGRMGHKQRDDAIGINPCGEIPLEDKELCNLVEVFPTRCKTEKEFIEAIELATIYASSVSLLRTHSEMTNAIIAKNRRIGVSISGIPDWMASVERKSDIVRLLNAGYDLVKQTNIRLAIEAGVPPSVRLTTIKPSGTISLLAGVSPGMHHPIFQTYIRRVKFGIHSPVIPLLEEAGVPYEPDVTDPTNTLTFEFPIHMKGVRAQNQVSLAEHGLRLILMSRFWTDNAASNTSNFRGSLYENESGTLVPYDADNPKRKLVKKGEEEEIESWLSMVIPHVKSSSMLPYYNGSMTHKQMPYEEISYDEFETRRDAIADIDWTKFEGSDGMDSRYCEGDQCIV